MTPGGGDWIPFIYGLLLGVAVGWGSLMLFLEMLSRASKKGRLS